VGLQKKLDKLFRRIDKLEKDVKALEQVNANLLIENKQLRQEVKNLKSQLQPAKDSSNSSVPPSKDENRVKKSKSLRKSSGKKPGGQPGHKGTTLKMTETPDIIHKNIPDECHSCGLCLQSEAEFIGKRQVIDLEFAPPQVTEYQIYGLRCSCGHLSKSDYPKDVRSPVSYGSNIEALINYLSVRQYLSLERIEEFLYQVMGLNMSQGTIVNKLKSFKRKSIKAYEKIRKQVSNSAVVGADETGCVVNGDKYWVWTWQTEKQTYIAVSPSRGYIAIENNFPQGFPNSILVSDCWAAQLKTNAKEHQICIAHLQRELNYFIELGKEKWSSKFSKIIKKALILKKEMTIDPSAKFKSKVNALIEQSKKLIEQNVNGPPKLITLKKRLKKRIDCLWVFLKHFAVPPDNNASERAIRNVKVKQKISGLFKTTEGAMHFAVVRSIIDTAIKNKTNIFDEMSEICSI